MTPSTQTIRLWSLLRHSLFAVLVSALAACASSGNYQQDLMNAPDIYDEGGIDPFADISPIDVADYSGILYATSIGERDKKVLETELAQIKQAAADPLAIKERNRSLSEQIEALTADLETARQRNRALKERSERDWFIAGAGVLLGGMVLGLVIPRIRWKRRRGWGEL